MLTLISFLIFCSCDLPVLNSSKFPVKINNHKAINVESLIIRATWCKRFWKQVTLKIPILGNSQMTFIFGVTELLKRYLNMSHFCLRNFLFQMVQLSLHSIRKLSHSWYLFTEYTETKTLLWQNQSSFSTVNQTYQNGHASREHWGCLDIWWKKRLVSFFLTFLSPENLSNCTR